MLARMLVDCNCVYTDLFRDSDFQLKTQTRKLIQIQPAPHRPTFILMF